MTRHPFDRDFSEREIIKLNSLEEQDGFEELTLKEAKQIFGGGCDHFNPDIKKIDPPKATTMALGEEGGDPY